MEQKFPRRWNKKTRIDFLQRKIILNCIAYYELNTNKLSDKEYDELSRQLVRMQEEYEGIIKEDTQYGYVFYDFDGSTGFDLYHRLNEHDKQYLLQLANVMLMNDIKIQDIKPPKKKKGALF